MSTETKHFGIGRAIDLMLGGGFVARSGWNGKGMYLGVQRPDENSANKQPYIYIIPTDGAYRVPWTASQPDLLGLDWYEVEEKEEGDGLGYDQLIAAGKNKDLVYYGPHPCRKCDPDGKFLTKIVKAGNGAPDYLEFDYPGAADNPKVNGDGNAYPYPNTHPILIWLPHEHVKRAA